MANGNILQSLQQPVNSVAKAYTERTTQLATQDAAAQKSRDDIMGKVFEFAGDGRTDEAKFMAQQHGVEIPEEVLTNSDFSKGLSLAGKFYPQDPAAAQKFTMAWMQNQQGDFQSRLVAAQQATGVPIDPADREYQRKMHFELWKVRSIPKDPDVSRFKAGQDSYDSVMKGMGTAADAEAARQSALSNWNTEYGGQNAAGSPAAQPISLPAFGTAPAMDGNGAPMNPMSVRNNNPGNMRPVGASTGMQKFDTPQDGLRAMRKDLVAKINGASRMMKAQHGAKYTPTLANIISTWAPPAENDTAAYVMFVSQKTGIGPSQVVTQADIDRLIPAMIEFEGGNKASQYFGGQQPQGTQMSVGATDAPQQAQNPQAIPSGLPQGSVMIGTANGRPVYQDPQGNRYVDDGNP